MPNVQTQVSRRTLAELRSRAILQGKSLKDLLNEIITQYLEKEDEQWLKKQMRQPQNDLES